MKKSPIYIALIFLTGCASYNASSLNSVSIDTPANDVVIAAKAFDIADCKKYLDRDVISKGFQPVQLYIQNNTNKSYAFSTDRVSLATAKSHDVATKVHTSTLGRVMGYGAAAWLTFGILAIPAIVDGIKSSNANQALDTDFYMKTAHSHTILPHSHLNKIIFIPANEYQSSFTVTLLDVESNTPKILAVNTQ